LPEIRPFPGVSYRLPAAELPQVLAPPYDVISPAYQEELYARDPRNVVRAILNRTPGDAGYQEAGETYRRWLAEGVMTADPQPALYVLEQQFRLEGRPYTRRGLLARFRAEDPARRVVLPHEQTRPAAREDRYRVLLATRANFSPVFLMVPDPSGSFASALKAAAERTPDVSFADDAGVGHRLWRLTEPATLSVFERTLGPSKAYIADGHHRYATALRYRDERGPDGAWTFGYFTPLTDPGLVVLPYHRVLAEAPPLAEARRRLERAFLLSEVADAAAAAHDAAQSTMPYAFGLAEAGGGALVAEALPEADDLLPEGAPGSLRPLDSFFLHQAVLRPLLGVADEAVRYVHSLAAVVDALRQQQGRLAVLMRPTPVRQVVDVAEAGESMPPKSTFFHPKLPSGLVIHPLVV